jgi:hypothetical protein
MQIEKNKGWSLYLTETKEPELIPFTGSVTRTDPGAQDVLSATIIASIRPPCPKIGLQKHT